MFCHFSKNYKKNIFISTQTKQSKKHGLVALECDVLCSIAVHCPFDCRLIGIDYPR